MSNPKAERIVIVTGDVAMDWNLAQMRPCKGDRSLWSANDATTMYWQRGGSALLADLVETIAEELQRNGFPRVSIRQTAAPRTPHKVHTDDDQYHHSYASWSPFKSEDEAKTPWRVERFLGMDLAGSDVAQEWQKVVNDTPDVDLVILDDAG